MLFLRPSDFKGKVGTTKAVQTLWMSRDGPVYGNITLTYQGGNKVSSAFDIYDFEMHSWWSITNWVRNFITMYGDPGPGRGFRINLNGQGTIGDDVPFIYASPSLQ